MNKTAHVVKEFKHIPSAVYRFFLYDPEGCGMIYFSSKENRDEFADEAIKNYLDDTWIEDVAYVCVGEVTHSAQVLEKTFPPPMSELDEDGYDEDGNTWEGIEWRGNYKLEPLRDLTNKDE